MGSEIGQFKEWAFDEGIEYFLLEYEKHKKYQQYVKKLGEIYKTNPAFYEIERSWDGFEWLIADDSYNSTFALARMSKGGKKVVVIANFSGIEHKDYRIGIEKGKYKLLLNSDAKSFGGDGGNKKRLFTTKNVASHGKKQSIVVDIAPFSCIYLEKSE